METLCQLGSLHFSLNRVRPLLPLCLLCEHKDPIFSLTQNTEQKMVACLPCVMGIYWRVAAHPFLVTYFPSHLYVCSISCSDPNLCASLWLLRIDPVVSSCLRVFPLLLEFWDLEKKADVCPITYKLGELLIAPNFCCESGETGEVSLQ